jgi:hypothetical protein
MYEYIIPSEILFADANDWAPLVAVRDGVPMAIAKPFTGTKAVALERAYGNQSANLGYSLFHVTLQIDSDQREPEWSVPLELVNDCLQWIRVAGLQYWIGYMPTANKDIARGSIHYAENNYTNFGSVVCPVLIRPLTQQIWEWIGGQLSKNRIPTIPDLLVSDALISFGNADFLQTVIRLGVICELALNAFIDDLLACQPKVARDLYDERKPFEKKLRDIPAVLGAEKYQEHNPTRFKHLTNLYQLRGAAIHRAELKIDNRPIHQDDVVNFIWATLDLLQWTQDQRVKLNIPL